MERCRDPLAGGLKHWYVYTWGLVVQTICSRGFVAENVDAAVSQQLNSGQERNAGKGQPHHSKELR